MFKTGVADAVDGFYHAFYSSKFSDFGIGPLPSAAASAIAALGEPAQQLQRDLPVTSGHYDLHVVRLSVRT